jgi:GNAT superfamily N-acetyltransferase
MATYVEVIEMHIRDAVPEDAPSALRGDEAVDFRTMQRRPSRRDPAILARWLANKTPEIVASWIVQPGNSVLVAVESGTMLAVDSVTEAGEITLNYVSPDARFRGVSRALLVALETRAQNRGNQRCTLLSTETAHRVYQTAGYIDDGPPQGKFGTTSSYPMSKELAGPQGS